MLHGIAPWTAAPAGGRLPGWNPLRWDGIAQFYPWRLFAHEVIRQGRLPLWNPYQFCGAPFVANSQSAVLYPLTVIFYLLPVVRAFAVSAFVHLTLCGWFTYLLFKRLRCRGPAALMAGVIYAFSAWQVAWLQLPTFLTTSCWIPLVLRQIHVSVTAAAPRSARRLPGMDRSFGASIASLGAVVGMMLLAGHLQIAFYGLLTGALWLIGILISRRSSSGLKALMGCGAGMVLGVLLASPQLLPAVELSRMSHRVGPATSAGYRAYTEYALQPGELAGLAAPELFGTDTDPSNPYWGFYEKSLPGGRTIAVRHNAAETAVFVGVITLTLGVLAVMRGIWARPPDRRVLFFGALATLALLLALGSPLDAVLYFGIPGFAQSGSPARVLVLWALAWAGLAAVGLDSLAKNPTDAREAVTAVSVASGLCALGLALVAVSLATPPEGAPTLAVAAGHIAWAWARAIAALAVAIAILSARLDGALRVHVPVWWPGTVSVRSGVAVLAVTAELVLAGIGVNPTAQPRSVYPATAAVSFLRQHLGHDRIFPVNHIWSLYHYPPAVLPPNAAMVYDIRDVQGYDSLFPGTYKAFADQFARLGPSGTKDASPPEVGNMVFFQDPSSPAIAETGAALAVTVSPTSHGYDPGSAPNGRILFDAPGDMAVYAIPNAGHRAYLDSEQSATAANPIEWREDDPTRVVLRVAASQTAHLVLADQYYPGWQAFVDGHRTPVAGSKASGARVPVFRQIAVPSGTHTVRFVYEPSSFRAGLYLACAALATCVCLAISSTRARGS